MVLGSLASRITGFLRSAVVAAALGTGLTGDAYNVANTLPNIVFMLLLGGALNSVFVPELVRAARRPDGGAAFTDRLVTACLTALLAICAVAVCAAPWLVHLYAPSFTDGQSQTAVALARYCLPQIFFYGVFAVLGQVLNARERFGAMAWAPVANNLVVIGVFALFLGLVGRAGPAGMSPGQTLWLGVGSTAGIVVQALAVVPSLRRSGYRWRPRFDWRGPDLAAPLRAAGWTLALVGVGQAGFWVITVLATGAGERAAAGGVTAGVGLTAYNNAYQLWTVPQGVLTVAVVTAALPALTRAAQGGDHRALTDGLTRTVRSSAGIIVLVSAAFLSMGAPLAALAYGYGAVTDADVRILGLVLVAFAPGLPAYCAQYALTRGFYALGDARTPVLLALVTTGANAALSTTACHVLPARWAVVGMAAAHTTASFVGIGVTSLVLSRRIHRQAGCASGPAPRGLAQTGLHVRAALACAPGAAAAASTALYLREQLGHGTAGSLAAVTAGGLLLAVSVLALAGPLRVHDAFGPLGAVLNRLHRPSRPGR
ncbi:murein biosynthesis integral membrane protein MurJ [Kitasatospora sp. NPDC101176]|uniref:murein biosynthesis integral membrane protein MurJ n=1 Tax=Kitasatospora sp. NPDC101176 TaxID=3364099 RepID=UPI00382730DB